MKKSYTKPKIVVETFTPQQVLCACAVVNKMFSEYQQCGFMLEGVDLILFADSWAACQLDGTNLGYCYQPGPNNLFSS